MRPTDSERRRRGWLLSRFGSSKPAAITIGQAFDPRGRFPRGKRLSALCLRAREGSEEPARHSPCLDRLFDFRGKRRLRHGMHPSSAGGPGKVGRAPRRTAQAVRPEDAGGRTRSVRRRRGAGRRRGHRRDTDLRRRRPGAAHGRRSVCLPLRCGPVPFAQGSGGDGDPPRPRGEPRAAAGIPGTENPPRHRRRRAVRAARRGRHLDSVAQGPAALDRDHARHRRPGRRRRHGRRRHAAAAGRIGRPGDGAPRSWRARTGSSSATASPSSRRSPAAQRRSPRPTASSARGPAASAPRCSPR